MSRSRPPLLVAALVLCAGLLVLVPTAIAADAGLIAFQGNRRDAGQVVDQAVYTMAPDGTGMKRIRDGIQPSISRDGKTIAFVKSVGPEGEEHPEIFVMTADGDNLRQVTHDRSADSEPAISPDGKQIVFVGDRRHDSPPGEPSHLFVVDVDGSNQRQLTKGKQIDLEPSFSPDGKRLVFVRGPGESKLATVAVAGGEVTVLTRQGDPYSGPQAPSYSPNGNRIVFQGFADVNRVFTCDPANGRDIDRLTRGDSEGLEPAYAPNGQAIVFRRGPNLFRMAPDGSGVDQLTGIEREDGSNIRPSWGR